jgi:hypothetical protein
LLQPGTDVGLPCPILTSLDTRARVARKIAKFGPQYGDACNGVGAAVRVCCRIPKVIEVLRELRNIELVHCKLSLEEVAALSEVRRLQRESEHHRAADVLAEGLYVKLAQQEEELAAARNEAVAAVRERDQRVQKEADDVAAQNVQCVVCWETVKCVCAAVCEKGHAFCPTCLGSEVQEQTSGERMAEFQKADMRLRCTVCPRGSEPLAAREVVACLDEEAFEKLLAARDKLTEGIAVAGPQRRVRELETVLAAERAATERQILPLLQVRVSCVWVWAYIHVYWACLFLLFYFHVCMFCVIRVYLCGCVRVCVV